MDLSHACKLFTKNCFLAKVDLQSAYRTVNIHPSNYRFTGLNGNLQMTAVLHICMMQNYLLGLQKALAFFRDV